MKSVQKIDLGLTGYDELFMNDAERKENNLPRIYDIPLSEIDDFPNHPFKVKLDEDMDHHPCHPPTEGGRAVRNRIGASQKEGLRACRL